MVNKVFLKGRVSSDLEIRYFSSDYLQIRFSIETEEEISGLDHPLVQYHNLVVRGELARSVELVLDKGKRVSIEGSLRYRKETDRLGHSSVRTEIECRDIRLMPSESERERLSEQTPSSASTPISELPWESFAPEEGEDPFA